MVAMAGSQFSLRQDFEMNDQRTAEKKLCQCVGEREVKTGGDCRCGRCGLPTIGLFSSNPHYVFCCGGEAKCTGGCECQCHDLTDEVQRLQRALAFWLPRVPAGDEAGTDIGQRIGDDAMLLAGYEGPDEPCAEERGLIKLHIPADETAAVQSGAGMGIHRSQNPDLSNPMVWAALVYEDHRKLLQEGGGDSLAVRADRAFGILFGEIERLEKIAHPVETSEARDRGSMKSLSQQIRLAIQDMDDATVANLALRAAEELEGNCSLLRSIKSYMIPGKVMPVPEQVRYIVGWIDAALDRASESEEGGL